MKKYSILLVLALMLVSLSCKNEQKEDAEDPRTEGTEMKDEQEVEVKKITVELEPRSGSNAEGNVVFREENGEVTMTAVLGGLEEGTHAIHLHENADCSADDGTSAGGHWNPTFSQHGKWGDSDGYHKGDIGNFNADASGNGTISMTTDEWCIGCGDEKKDITGKAVIVHQGEDDFTSQPSGAAGSRISCGGIIN